VCVCNAGEHGDSTDAGRVRGISAGDDATPGAAAAALKAAVAAAPKLAKPKAQEPKDDEAEAPSEPTKRAGKKEEVVAPKSKLADVLDQWDDEG
jgi:hypothetical protein